MFVLNFLRDRNWMRLSVSPHLSLLPVSSPNSYPEVQVVGSWWKLGLKMELTL